MYTRAAVDGDGRKSTFRSVHTAPPPKPKVEGGGSHLNKISTTNEGTNAWAVVVWPPCAGIFCSLRVSRGASDIPVEESVIMIRAAHLAAIPWKAILNIC